MCGIAGFYNVIVSQQEVNDVISKLRHRGPDDQHFFVKDDVGLIHTRLSIIELSSLGAQPYRFEHLVLVFNGELYNYKEVREDLQKLGYVFQSNADTEVLIKAFHCWREKCVDRFIGMFAFAVYDEQNDEVYLFRDRVGVKPLYYSYVNKKLYFASELKALSVFPIPKEISTDAVSLYFRFGFIPHHLSIYQNVFKVEAGSFVKITRSGITKSKYWDTHLPVRNDRTEAQWLDELEALLISSFRYRMVSDVPVGVFLSGGIDSSLVTSILQKHEGNIHTFTIGFEESRFDESNDAKRISSKLGTTHSEKILMLGEAKELFHNFYSIYDEPFADTSGIPTACVAKLVRDSGIKVVLSGDGGDELFGGYTHYQTALNAFNNFSRLPFALRRAVAGTTKFLLPAAIRKQMNGWNLEHKSYAFEELIESNDPVLFFENLLANQSVREISLMMQPLSRSSIACAGNGQGVQQSMMNWDFKYYLPDDLLVKVDRATMFYGVEAREPFLDHRLIEFAQQIPMNLKINNGNGKYLLRKLLSQYLPTEQLDRPKKGFSIPIFSWFINELDEMFEYYLSPDKLKSVTFFNAKEIIREYEKYSVYKKQGKQYNIEKMWRLLSFMMWWEKHEKGEF